ncbi:MAG: CHAT domain-containing protein [Pseudomonadota bacterium]
MIPKQTGSPSFLRSRAAIVALIPLIGCLFMTLIGCKTDSMSVKEAKDVAVQFQGTFKTVPPRGLGTAIERTVAYYKDPATVPPEYLVPRQKFTDEELREVHEGVNGQTAWARPRYYATWAYNEYLLGNLSLSTRLADLAISTAPENMDGNKMEGYAIKALILAEAGDYKGADRALSSADFHFNRFRDRAKRSRGSNHPRTLLLNVYLTRARAAIYFARGELAAAEQTQRKLLVDIDEYRHHESFSEPATHETEARVNLARVLLAQGRVAEAEIYVREAIRYGHRNVLPSAFLALSQIFFAQGRYEDALVCARTSLHITASLRAPIDAFIRANIRADYARAFLALGQYKESLRQFNLIEEELKTDPETFNRRFKGSAEWGLALLMAGDARAALEKLKFAARESEKISGPDTYALGELRALHAMALAQSGQTEAALTSFDRNVPELLKKFNSEEEGISSQTARSFKFKLILEAYLTLLADSGKPANFEKSFQFASALQDKLIGRAVAMSSARSAVKDPALSSLIRQRQDLELKLSSLKNCLSSALYAPPELINTEVINELQNQVETLNLAAETLAQDIKARFPEYENIVNPDNADVTKVRSTLGDSEALISIFSGKNYTFTWAVPKTGAVSLVKAPIGRARMAAVVDELREALNPGGLTSIMDLPPYDLKLAYTLYEQTLKPVEAGWKKAKNLMVITQGPIGQIPLSILPTTPAVEPDSAPGKPGFSKYQEENWLIKTHSVTVLPSVSALINLRSFVAKKTERVAYAGFGDPYFNLEQLAEAETEASKEASRPAMRNAPVLLRGIRVTKAGALDKEKIASVDISMLNRLPDTREEVIDIAASLKADIARDVYLGRQASEHTIKSMTLDDRRVVVFATHGLVAGDLDGLDQPALALSAPAVTGNADEDGLLTMGEIMGLRLNADWVVLSACNTGAAEGDGAEAVSGLGQAFFYAGARSLLVTGWPVETVSAKMLTTSLFQRQLAHPDSDRAQLLRLTMIDMIEKKHEHGFSYAHPIFWAPFSIVGDGRQ